MNSCTHASKVCKDLKWGKSTGQIEVKGERYSSYLADVALWYCKNCNQHLVYDWHVGRYEPLLKGMTV